MGMFPQLGWMATAIQYLGTKEIKGTRHNTTILTWLQKLNAWWSNDEVPWCGVFVAECLRANGLPYPKHWYRALDYANFGAKLSKPAYGCVAVKTRKGGGHVCFVAGITPSGKLVCLGGNQADMVCYALYDVKDFQHFRWVGTQPSPASHRYNLPVMKNVTATSVTEA